MEKTVLSTFRAKIQLMFQLTVATPRWQTRTGSRVRRRHGDADAKRQSGRSDIYAERYDILLLWPV